MSPVFERYSVCVWTTVKATATARFLHAAGAAYENIYVSAAVLKTARLRCLFVSLREVALCCFSNPTLDSIAHQADMSPSIKFLIINN